MKKHPRLAWRVPATALAVWVIALATSIPTMRAAPSQAPVGEAPIPATVEFSRDVRPILSDKCYRCHGPGTQMASLRFDTEEGAKRALRGDRYAIVPRDPDASQLIARVTMPEGPQRMPQGGEPLSAREVGVLRRWIEQGAEWQGHWAFIPPKRPAEPAVQDATWVRNPIDRFVLARLEQEGLRPSPEAERETLIRRVSFDLTGLPPTPAEIDAFLADGSPQAYERLVDRLLASPRYGDRMAFPWLEAARYADSHGYQSDGERFMWRWRDWVINAFNANMSFDRFTVEQLAGDLLPNATLDQRIATGFNRNHRGNAEGGIIEDEYRVEYVVDRVDTTATVFMGLTAGCARCHDHKYDPLSQKEFYQLTAYFGNIPERGKSRRIGNSPPMIQAPLPEQAAELARLQTGVDAAERAFAGLEDELKRSQRQWEQSLASEAPLQWQPSRGLVAHYPLDGTSDPAVLVPLENARGRGRVPGGRGGRSGGTGGPPAGSAPGKVSFAPGRVGEAGSFDGTSFVEGTDLPGFTLHRYYEDAYTMAAWIYPTAPTGAIVTKAFDEAEPRGHGLNLTDGKLEYNNVNKWVDEAIRIHTEESIPLNEWHHVAVTFNGDRTADGVTLYVDGKPWPFAITVDDLNNRLATGRQPLRIGGGGGPDNRFKGRIDNVHVYNRELAPAEVAVLATASTLNEIAATPPDRRTAAEADKIRDYFLERAASEAVRSAWARLLEARARLDEYDATIPTVMVMEERPTPPSAHVLIRGAYDRPGEEVFPTLPSALAPLDVQQYPANRLGFARWLVNPSHPLLARVTMNRFWQAYFGTGIVRTSEDFGSQGERPSHPELLDWLATEFIRTGWDVKGMQKLIVMSATYRQSSSAPEALISRDPANGLLARGPRKRLSAAMVRDQALALSGLLVEKVGGPSVKPYQPAGLWEELASETYNQGHGDDLYRRSLYTYWRRTIPPPNMANFDASSREAHVVRSESTNTPLQALNLMNDVAFLEAARMMGERVMREGGASDEERIEYAFRLSTGRRPAPPERRVLVDFLAFQLDRFGDRAENAVAFLNQGEHPRDESLDARELAAYSVLSSFVMNLDEAITRN